MTESATLQTAFARLHRLAEAQGLPGVTATGDSAPALHVDGTPFAEIFDPQTAVLHCPADQKVLLMEISPAIYFETETFVGQDAMLIRLGDIDDEELSLRLHDAWTFKAPEHLKKRHT